MTVSTAALQGGVLVSAQQNGVIISSTAPNATTGEFFLARLPVGNYDVVITSNTSAATVIATVPVTSTTSTTALSTAAAPIALAASNTGTITGAVTLTPINTTEAGVVSAKQRFAAGQTAVIKYQGADLLTGTYTISNLPVAAPLYALILPHRFSAGHGQYLLLSCVHDNRQPTFFRSNPCPYPFARARRRHTYT